MTAEAFTNWLAAMKAAGLAVTDQDCANLLGWTRHGVIKAKKTGSTHTTALACAALLNGLAPYS